MKKLVFVFILVFVMGAVLQGCGTKNEIVDSSSSSGDFSICWTGGRESISFSNCSQKSGPSSNSLISFFFVS